MGVWEDIKFLITYPLFSGNWIRLVLALLAVTLSIVLRRVFIILILKYLKREGSNSGTILDNYIIKAVEVPARFLIIVLGFWAAVIIMDFPTRHMELLTRVLRSLIVFSVFRAAYRVSDFVTVIIEKIMQHSETKLDDMLLLFVRKSLKILILVIGTVTIIQEWYDNIGGLMAGLGLGGLAFALAARDTVANLFGSVTIMMDKPFRIGDWVKTPHAEGVVEEIGFRSTRIRTFSQALITVPNSTMSNDPVTNWSRMGKRRISFRVGLSFETSPEKLIEYVGYCREILQNNPDIHSETIVVCFERFNESVLEILFCFFTRTIEWKEYLGIQEEINLQILGKLQEMGIQPAMRGRDFFCSRDGAGK